MRRRLTYGASRFFPELGIKVRPRGDGLVDITLPPIVAEAFILNLTFWARETQEALGKARIQEAERQAELLVESGETQRRLEAQEEDWAREYAKLRADGLGHREALHRIHEGLDAKLGIEVVELGVSHGRARLRRRGEMGPPHRLTQAKAHERQTEIIRLAQEGLDRRELADKFRVSYTSVFKILKKAGVDARDARHVPPGTVRGGRWGKRQEA
jgi:hypothetical protein